MVHLPRVPVPPASGPLWSFLLAAAHRAGQPEVVRWLLEVGEPESVVLLTPRPPTVQHALCHRCLTSARSHHEVLVRWRRRAPPAVLAGIASATAAAA